MFGDYLRTHIDILSNATLKKVGDNCFWKLLQSIAVNEIKSVYPDSVDSDIAVPIYYKILKDNKDKFDPYFSVVLDSNKQERFRVINRNLWTSNAFHPDGLANHKGIIANKSINEAKKGYRIIFKWKGDNN